MAGPSMDQMLKQAAELQERMHTMQGSAQHMSTSFQNFFRSMVGANLIAKALDPIFSKVEKFVLSTASSMAKTPLLLRQEWEHRRQIIGVMLAQGDINAKMAAAMHRALDTEWPLELRRRDVARAYAGTNKLALTYIGLAVAATANLLHESTELNRTLINTNSDLNNRNRLLRVGLDTVILTGQGFDDVLQAQRTLSQYGLETRKDYAQTVETVVMLHKGIGLSVEHAAELAVIVQNQVRGSFVQVSDVLTNIVNQTALVADEAARMTKELGMLLTMIRGQSGGNLLPEMTKSVARYEDALKRISGTTGAVTELIKRAAGPEGFGMAGMLGVYSPDMLATQQGIDTLMANFRRLGDRLVGESTGWQRRMGLDALAKMMGMSAEQVNALYLATRNVNQGVTDELTLRERYQQQTRDLGQTLAQLGNRLLGLLERGLYPFVVGLNFLATGLNRLLDALSHYKPVVTVLTTMVTVAFPLAILMIMRLAASLYRLAIASAAAKLGIDAQTASLGGILRSLLGLGTGAAGQGIFFQIGRALGYAIGFLLTPIGATLAAIAGGLLLTGYWLKRIHDVNVETQAKAREADWRHTAGLMNLAQRQRELITFNTRYGRFDGIDTKIKSYLSDVGGALAKEGLTGEAYASRLREAARDLRSDVDRAAYTTSQFSESRLTPQQQQMLDKQLDVESAVTKSGEVMAKTYKDVGNRNYQMLREQQQEMNLKWYQEIGVDAVDKLGKWTHLWTPLSK